MTNVKLSGRVICASITVSDSRLSKGVSTGFSYQLKLLTFLLSNEMSLVIEFHYKNWAVNVILPVIFLGLRLFLVLHQHDYEILGVQHWQP